MLDKKWNELTGKRTALEGERSDEVGLCQPPPSSGQKLRRKTTARGHHAIPFLVVFPIFHWLVKFCANPACSTLAMILQIFLL